MNSLPELTGTSISHANTTHQGGSGGSNSVVQGDGSLRDSGEQRMMESFELDNTSLAMEKVSLSEDGDEVGLNVDTSVEQGGG